MNFFDIIAPTLEQKGITPYKICKDLNISQNTFSGWKAGKQPALDKAITVLRYLEVSADELLELKPTKYTDEERKIINQYRTYNEKDKALLKAYMELLNGEQNHDTEDQRLYS